MDPITNTDKYLRAENSLNRFIDNMHRPITLITMLLHFHTIGAYSSNFYVLGSTTGNCTKVYINCSIKVQAKIN